MKRFVSVVAGVALAALAGTALAFMGPGGGPRGMGYGPMGMGPGMMHSGTGQAGCPGMGAAGGGTAQTPITEGRAKELAQQYADEYLPGFTVDKVLPFTGRHMAMYAVELKGPNDEVRVLHVNPFGNVMPFGGPWRRGA